MADFFNKAKTEYATLKKTLEGYVTALEKLENNNGYQLRLATEAGDEISRRIEVLRGQGTDGDTIGDFDRDKDVKASLAAIKDATSKSDSYVKEFAKTIALTKMVQVDFEDLAKRCDKEVADRTKKKDRKVLAIDSKSLPLIEELADKARAKGKSVDRDVVKAFKPISPPDAKQVIAEAVKNAKDVAAKDNAEMGDRSLQDKRVFGKRRDQALGACAATIKACKISDNAVKAGNMSEAKKAIVEANNQMKIVMLHTKHYTDLMKSVQPGLRRIYENDAKYAHIMPGIKAMQREALEAGKALKASAEKVKAAKQPA
ncbi:hypothetical protein [Sphingomonas jatrophae]|uniref:Uncharacterized protein n=1 Tax=Sphingomonas jatrophae TaxID=1166337 RepID=A0A1I6JGY0_9SPHN|nr:hypothetical protein [Sphingomonas jatrophae]SFR78238.1 hypothetical protein SAMN05192580_0260 [Sphingomonas jatrophae]